MNKEYSNVVVYENKTELSTNAANEVYSYLSQKIDQNYFPKVSLTGGSIGISVLESLSKISGIEQIVNDCLWFWGDERFLDKGNKNCNYVQAREALFDKLSDLNENNVIPFPANSGIYTNNPSLAAETYENILKENLENAFSKSFDLNLLGMGPDGHINSLFPHKPTLDITTQLVTTELDSPKPPPIRLTMTLPIVNASEQIFVIVSGKEKSEAITEIISGGNTDLPAGKLDKNKVIWLLDKEAAIKL